MGVDGLHCHQAIHPSVPKPFPKVAQPSPKRRTPKRRRPTRTEKQYAQPCDTPPEVSTNKVAPPDLLKTLGIINLSNISLSTTQAAALGKGLSFVPTPPQTPIQALHLGANKFSRSLKIKHFFPTLRHQEQNKFRIPSTFTPPPGTFPPEIEEIGIILKQQIRRLAPSNPDKPNLTPEQTQALDLLRKNKDIVVKPADKGSAIVIMNRKDYILEADRQLAVARHYKSIPQPIFPDRCELLNDILRDMKSKKLISAKEFNFLKAEPSARERYFYLLPKIHKDPLTWTVPHKVPPGRPIVSDVSSESHNIALFIEYHLAPFSSLHKSYVKNTYDFLHKLSKVKALPTSLLISMDVDSLYTNIDNDMGLKAVSELFSKAPHPAHESVLRLLRASLEGNDFTFNGHYYLQISGVSMGKVYSPSFANLTMSYWEEINLSRAKKQPTLYLRYLDDIFIIWDHSREDFQQFYQMLNSAHPNITLKANVQAQELEFLDVLVYKGKRFQSEGHFDTKVYFKPTDSHALLHKDSYHPKHTFGGIIKSQMIRFARICNQEQDFDEATAILFKALTSRGYTERFLRNIKNSTKHLYFRPQRSPAMKPCGSARCSLCSKVFPCSYLPTPTGPIQLCAPGDCNTLSAVYVIGCFRCPEKIYVGQTSGLRARLLTHLSTIRTHKQSKLTNHFHEPDHSLEDLFVSLLESGPATDDVRTRTKLERNWIRKLDALNKGLNSHPGEPQNLLPFIVPHSPAANDLKRTCKVWLEDFYLQHPTLSPADLVLANSRHKSLSQLLVSALLPASTETTGSQ